jgi:hypothetical protein
VTNGASTETPRVVRVSSQLGIVSSLRLLLGAAGLVGASLDGLRTRSLLAEAAFGGVLFLFAVFIPGGRRAPWAADGAAVPLLGAVEAEPRWRTAIIAAYPSTVGVAVLSAIAFAFDVRLVALLAGVLVGMGLGSLGAAARVLQREREQRIRLYLDRRSPARRYRGPA